MRRLSPPSSNRTGGFPASGSHGIFLRSAVARQFAPRGFTAASAQADAGARTSLLLPVDGRAIGCAVLGCCTRRSFRPLRRRNALALRWPFELPNLPGTQLQTLSGMPVPYYEIFVSFASVGQTIDFRRLPGHSQTTKPTVLHHSCLRRSRAVLLNLCFFARPDDFLMPAGPRRSFRS